MSDTLFVGSFEDRKLKRKIDESSIIDEELDLSLSLSLGGNYVVIHQSSSKSALKSLKVNGDLGFDPKLVEKYNEKEVIKPMEHQFSCKFCDKKFPNPQALGGHQNAYRNERILSRMDIEFAKSVFGLGAHLCPYSSPLYRGVHMHHLAHMSPIPWCGFEVGNGNRGLYNTSFLDHQFRMTSNSWSTSVESRQRSNHKDVGFCCELYQVPPLAGDVVNRFVTTRHDPKGLRGNYYIRNH